MPQRVLIGFHMPCKPLADQQPDHIRRQNERSVFGVCPIHAVEKRIIFTINQTVRGFASGKDVERIIYIIFFHFEGPQFDVGQYKSLPNLPVGLHSNQPLGFRKFLDFESNFMLGKRRKVPEQTQAEQQFFHNTGFCRFQCRFFGQVCTSTDDRRQI